jgi:hypothetical protein
MELTQKNYFLTQYILMGALYFKLVINAIKSIGFIFYVKI